MAKPLSQKEIDALLDTPDDAPDTEATTTDPELPSEETENVSYIEPYNFKRPRLFSQDQARVLTYVHEAFARDLSVYLSAQLRTIVDINLDSVDQVIYSEFVMSSAPPSAIYVVNVLEHDHKIVLEIDPRLAIYTIEKLFGGHGVFLEEKREISQIEQKIMRKVMEETFDKLEGAWEQAKEVELEIDAFETNAEFVQIIPAAEPAFVANYKVSIYEETSSINICYPYILLEKMLATSDMKQWLSSAISEAPPEVRERYERKLETTEVELRAELGRARVPLPELLRLEAGDVIPLQRRVKDPVRIYVNGREKFMGQAGKSGSYRAIKIIDVRDQIETEK
jgi:flagellar motor switch protein FliM